MPVNIIYSERPIVKISRNRNGSVIRINNEATEALEQFASASGKTISEIASNFIKFAAENSIVKEKEVG